MWRKLLRGSTFEGFRLSSGILRSPTERPTQSAAKVIAMPFMQYRRPVGCGPSSNT
jgi:hypothetical protein